MRICITGTPGTWKSSVAKKLAEKLNFECVSQGEIMESICIGYDQERECKIVDEKKLNKIFHGRDNFVFQGHVSHFLKNVDFVFVLRADIKELRKRLENRGWPEKKISENLQAEIFGIIAQEAREIHDAVFEIDTTNSSCEEVVEKILRMLR